MKFMPVLIVLAAVSLVVGMAFRLMGRYAYADITPSAFLRFTDTMLLFAIAIGFYLKFGRKAD
jgi:hypothetical protein